VLTFLVVVGILRVTSIIYFSIHTQLSLGFSF